MVSGNGMIEEEIKRGSARVTGSQVLIDYFSKLVSTLFDDITHQEETVVPIREAKITMSAGEQPLKAGWLYKKRDIFSGWRSRYFTVFPGRLEYYSDQNDLQPRRILSLTNAEILEPKIVKVKAFARHWGLMLVGHIV